MATIEQIVDRVEKRLSMASGLNVQVHAEDKLLEMLRHKYNVLFDSRWWTEYLTLETFTLDPLTGLITGSLTNKVRRFIDIHSVFLGSNVHALPIMNIGSNPSLQIGESIAPYAADTSKMFKVYPIGRDDDVHVWYRTRIADSAWDMEQASTTDVNMDDELLILGTVWDYLVDDGSNPDSASKFERQYAQRDQQLVNMSFQHGIAKQGNNMGIPTQWGIDG